MDCIATRAPLKRTRFSGCVHVGRPLSCRGFTVVELVTVIVLLSILSAVAISRMVSPDLFAPAMVTQALVAESRYAQQIATSRSDAVVTLTVDRAGADWRLQVATDVDGVIRTELVAAEDTTVQAVSGAANGAVGAGAALILRFRHSGDLAAVSIGAAVGDPDAGVGLTVAGGSTRQACVYSSGYATDAGCS